MIRSHRLSELCYESHSARRRAIFEFPHKYSPLEWVRLHHSPFLKPAVDFIRTFLPERLGCDFDVIIEDIVSRLDAIFCYRSIDNWLLPLSMPYWRKNL
jgi:hypothetical protein